MVQSNIMAAYLIDGYEITLRKKGSNEYTKTSYSIRYGVYSEIKTPDFIYQFNLNDEIKHIQGRRSSWPSPVEWLKRTVGNEWVYYSAGGYAGVYDCMGEYYIPCFPYSSTSILNAKPFKNSVVLEAIESWPSVINDLLYKISDAQPSDIREHLLSIKKSNQQLQEKSNRFHSLIGGKITVLPPDTRHVDYDVIPLTIADGCLYNCGFCKVKYGKKFKERSREHIGRQISELKRIYNKDILNYNSVFLGQHDALNASPDTILYAAEKAYEVFEFQNSYMKTPHLSLFGSVKSVLGADNELYESLNGLPYKTFINIGLESADNSTLKLLKKPVRVKDVESTFERMLEVNQKYENIEITANFVVGKELPPTHIPSILALIRDKLKKPYPKGAVYLSPLTEYDNKREVRDLVHKIKHQGRLPVYFYLIQRL